MSLSDSLTHFAAKAPAKKNRIDLLLEKLLREKPEDHATLLAALRDKNLRPSTLTQAIRKEYGIATVTEHSVGDWRRQHLAEVDGL